MILSVLVPFLFISVFQKFLFFLFSFSTGNQGINLRTNEYSGTSLRENDLFDSFLPFGLIMMPFSIIIQRSCLNNYLYLERDVNKNQL
jgi:hypothetical protein